MRNIRIVVRFRPISLFNISALTVQEKIELTPCPYSRQNYRMAYSFEVPVKSMPPLPSGKSWGSVAEKRAKSMSKRNNHLLRHFSIRPLN